MCNKLLLISFFLISSLLHSKNVLKFKLIANRIYLDASINDVPCVLLYDTGAFGLTLDSSFVKKNHMEMVSSRSMIDFKIDSFKKQVNGCNILNHQKYSKVLIEGIIGVDFFKDFTVEIDYLHSVLQLYGKEEKLPLNYMLISSKHNLKSFSLYGMFFLPLHLKINATSNLLGNFLFDTGSSRGVTIFNAQEVLKSTSKKVKIVRAKSSFYGFDQSIYFKTKEVLFGSVKLDSVLVDYSENISADFKKNNIIGVIGGDFLKEFDVLINYQASEIFIKKKEVNYSSGNDLVTDGFYVQRELGSNKIIVTSLVEMDCFLNDVKLKDEILEINNIKSDKINLEESEILKKTGGSKLEYKIKRGKEIFLINTEVLKLL